MQTGGFLENSRINNRISSSRFPLGWKVHVCAYEKYVSIFVNATYV
jgi:hypothetical protein